MNRYDIISIRRVSEVDGGVEQKHKRGFEVHTCINSYMNIYEGSLFRAHCISINVELPTGWLGLRDTLGGQGVCATRIDRGERGGELSRTRPSFASFERHLFFMESEREEEREGKARSDVSCFFGRRQHLRSLFFVRERQRDSGGDGVNHGERWPIPTAVYMYCRRFHHYIDRIDPSSNFRIAGVKLWGRLIIFSVTCQSCT